MFTINNEENNHNNSVQNHKDPQKKAVNTNYYFDNITKNRMKNSSYLNETPDKRTVIYIF